MSRPRPKPLVLDLFCGIGGAAMGYHLAGADVVGVDTQASLASWYPFPLIAADALAFAERYGASFDLIHASPPCQRYTHGNVVGDQAERHPDLVGPTRQVLEGLGVPWVLENVPRAPLRWPLVLCGTMFGLTATDTDGTELHLRRHRLFESNRPLKPPRPCHHPPGVQWAGAYGGARADKVEARQVRRGGYVPSRQLQAQLLGISWPTTLKGLQQAIPPAYTQWIGGLLL